MYAFGSLGQPFIRTGFGKHSLAASDQYVSIDRFDRQKSNIQDMSDKQDKRETQSVRYHTQTINTSA